MVSVLVSFRVVQRRSIPRCGIAPPASRTALKNRVPNTVALKSGRSAVRPRPCPRAGSPCSTALRDRLPAGRDAGPGGRPPGTPDVELRSTEGVFFI